MTVRHSCTLSANDFDVISKSNLRKGNYFVHKFREWTLIDKRHPQTKDYATSSAAFKKERRRHLRLKYSWIIHPFSKLRFTWNIVTTMVHSVAFVTIPFMTAFKVLDYNEVLVDDFNIYIYAICWVAVFMNCISGYYDPTNLEVVLEPNRILQYLKGFFLIDLLSSIPYDRLTFQLRVIPGPDSGILIPLINLIPNLKLLRMLSLNTYTRPLFKYLNLKTTVHQTCNTVIFSLFMLHWFACLCYILPTLMMYSQQRGIKDCECWMSQVDSVNPDMHTLYRHSLFMTVTNLAGSTYGSYPPQKEGHLLVCILLMLCGMIFMDYLMVMILKITSQRYIAETKYEEIMNQLHAYMWQKQLPDYMKRRLLAYYYYRFLKCYYRENDIKSTLSENLRREIALYSSRRFVQNVALFKDLPRNVLESIVVNLQMELYLPDDIIVKAGTQGDCMFFLASGTVAVLTPTGKEVCHLEDGAHFGEVALLVQDQRRVASVVAIEVCNVFRLARKDFRRCIAVHTDLFAKIERLATGRMEKTVLLEEQHKRFLLQRSTRKPSAEIRNLRTKSLYSTSL